ETSTGISNPNFYHVSDKLYPVSPNPASGKVKIGFTLGNSAMIDLKLYNTSGQEVSVLAANQYYTQGLYDKDLDLSGLAAGEYILSLQVRDKKYEQRIMVAK
ncbi:MAG: hypothetical protein JWO03_2065, partial [Bacteroidetes bacterium]|nr:hypothetical protein [Bacteroidota bacterium]